MYKIFVKSFNSFQTPNLNIWQIESKDAEDYHRVETDPEVKRYLNGPSSRTLTEARADIENYRKQLDADSAALNRQVLAILTKESGAYVGRCGVTSLNCGWDINVVLATAYHGRGYGLEVAEGFSKSLSRLSNVMSYSAKSTRQITKVFGFAESWVCVIDRS
jgi:RimJ/RimL family protein N-acetyltransferase